ncbi:hypothetical protein ACH3XW_17230 [Acanthocheilonema viteae]
MVSQQLIIIVVVAMSHITNTFACFSTGFCPCQTTVDACSCTQHGTLQPKSYSALFVSHKSSSSHPSPSYSAPRSSYLPYQPVPISRLPHPQTYNSPYTSYKTSQSLPKQSVVPSPSSYNIQRSTSNIMGPSKNYNPPYHIYGIHSQKMPSNTVTKVSQIYGPKRPSNELNENLQQIEVAPSIISSNLFFFLRFGELINDANQIASKRFQHTDIPNDATLPSQNVVILPNQQQHSIVAANSAQMITSFGTNTGVAINDKTNHQNAIILQRHSTANQNLDLIHSFDDPKNRHERKLSLCRRIINESGNHENIPIKCIALLTSPISSHFNDGLENVKKNSTGMKAHALNAKEFGANSNLNMKGINIPTVKSSIKIIHRAEPLQNLKSSKAPPSNINHSVTVLKENDHNSNKLLQKYQSSKTDENTSQKGIDDSLIGREKYIGQNIKAAFGKPTFKEVSSSGWTRRNDKLLGRTFDRTKGLNNVTEWIDYENSFYTTYRHQTCTGDRILEITFLKNVTGRFRNYGSYCVSKKSVGQVNSSYVIFGANTLSQARRFYNKSIRKGISYRAYREVNKREKQIVRS